jgi:hypothetical protein
MVAGAPGKQKHMKNAACFTFAALAVSLLMTAAAHAEGDGGLVEKHVKLLERVGLEADTHKPDCEKIGIALSRHQAEDAETMKAVKETLAQLSVPQRKALRDLVRAKYGERLKASQAKAAPLKACKTNPKVKAYADQVLR